MALVLLVLGGSAAAPAAHAHKPSDSYLSLAANGDRIDARWDVALRDLDAALGLDLDDDGRLTWGEVRTRQLDVAALVLSRLDVGSEAGRCDLASATPRESVQHALSTHSDGTYAVLQFELLCPGPMRWIDVHYQLFADSDPTHRGVVAITGSAVEGAGTQRAVLGPDRPRRRFVLGADPSWPTLLSFAADGVRHIWAGYDHLLFLVTLLLPAVLRTPRAGHASALQEGVERLPPVLWDVFRIVTAFTVAHSLTLTLAALDHVALPSRWVESAIAATVVLAAANNLRPVLRGRRWMAAFAFGLIHGFGFGQALKEQALPPDAVALSLLGFNLGVEMGQILIVALVMPLAFLLRNTRLYQRGVLRAGSVAVILVGTAWFFERALDLQWVSG